MSNQTDIPFTVIPRVSRRFDWNTDTSQLGVIRVPGASNGTSFDYNQKGIAISPASTLFLVGRTNDATLGGQRIAELTLPEPKIVTNLNLAPTATYKQLLTEPSEGAFLQVGSSPIKIGGILVQNNQLFISYYVYYDANGSQHLSQISRPYDLSVKGQVKGPLAFSAVVKTGSGHIENTTRYVNGYMLRLPPDIANIVGYPNLIGSVAENISGGSSNGPDFFGWDPSAFAANQPVKPLSYYPADRALVPYGQTSPVWNSTANYVAGACYIDGTDTILVGLTIGVGNWTYGAGGEFPNGTDWAYDPVNTGRGPHAFPYETHIMAFDIHDILNQVNPWDVRPYANWNISSSLPFPRTITLHDGSKVIKPTLNGIDFDSNRRRIILEVGQANNLTTPIFHVFQVS